jgi:hypothetical protein
MISAGVRFTTSTSHLIPDIKFYQAHDPAIEDILETLRDPDANRDDLHEG